jgi:hypothetical protein
MRKRGHFYGVRDPHLRPFYRQVIPTGLAAEVLVARSIKMSVTEYWALAACDHFTLRYLCFKVEE